MPTLWDSMTQLIKVATDTKDQTPVLLKVNEAPYLPHSPVTLLSEYQIREYGLVIDSVAKKHQGPNNTFGTQSFQVNPWVSIHLQDQGGLMGFEQLPIEDGDEYKYDVITITGPNPWNPNHFRGQHLQSQEHEPPFPSMIQQICLWNWGSFIKTSLLLQGGSFPGWIAGIRKSAFNQSNVI